MSSVSTSLKKFLSRLLFGSIVLTGVCLLSVTCLVVRDDFVVGIIRVVKLVIQRIAFFDGYLKFVCFG